MSHLPPPSAKRRAVARRRTPAATTAAEASSCDRAWAEEALPSHQAEGEDEVGYLWGMNIVTGELRDQLPGDDDEKRKEGLVQFSYGTYEGVQLSHSEVAKLKAEERASLIASRKLVLVLDLDHTLLNSAMLHELSIEQADAVAAAAGVPKWTVPPEAPPVSAAAAAASLVHDDDLIEEEEEEEEEATCGKEADGQDGEPALAPASAPIPALAPAGDPAAAPASAPAPARAPAAEAGGSAAANTPLLAGAERAEGLHWLPQLGLWTKLRPGLHEFLHAIVEKFELYVYTMGARKYAAAVVELLDPDGSAGLRGHDRVIASEDSTSRRLKGLDVVLGAEETTLIVDDSAAVWPEHAPQLLVPRRYHYFDSSAARDAAFGASPRGLLARGTDEPANLTDVGSQLGALLSALKRIHAHYFDSLDAATMAAAAASCPPPPPPHVRASVVEVRRQILAGVRLLFTRVIPLEEKRPKRHFAWRLALELGASVATSIEADVTHVIAGAARTDKAQWAERHGRKIVSLEWLTSCGYHWRRLDEADFPVNDETVSAAACARPSDTLPPPAIS